MNEQKVKAFVVKRATAKMRPQDVLPSVARLAKLVNSMNENQPEKVVQAARDVLRQIQQIQSQMQNVNMDSTNARSIDDAFGYARQRTMQIIKKGSSADPMWLESRIYSIKDSLNRIMRYLKWDLR